MRLRPVRAAEWWSTCLARAVGFDLTLPAELFAQARVRAVWLD